MTKMSKHGCSFLEMFDKIDVLNISKSSQESPRAEFSCSKFVDCATLSKAYSTAGIFLRIYRLFRGTLDGCI